MKYGIVPANIVDMTYICHNLRQRDREEILATRPDDDINKFAQYMIAVGGFHFIVKDLDGVPIACIGAVAQWRGTCEVWAFGTDRWPEVVRTLTKYAKRYMIPKLIEAGCHRAQCRSLASHTDAHDWLEVLGFSKVAVLDAFGRHREDFFLYARTVPDVSAENTIPIGGGSEASDQARRAS